MIQADSLAALAQKMEVPQEVFLQTAARYNSLGQNDVDFNKRPQYILPLQTGPFYALKIWPFRTTTIGGLVINKDAQVLNTQGSVIPGLYAGGEVANYSFFYNKYATCGSAVGHAITFGRIAGTNAAAIAP
jgi:predicted oxidoreductase